MPIEVHRDYVQCSTLLHLRKSAVIAIPKPSADRLEDFKKKYSFSKLVCDSDIDIIGRDGRALEGGEEYLIQELGISRSTHKAGAVCMKHTTEKCFQLLAEAARELVDISDEQLRNATEYITYDTAVRVRFSGVIAGCFSEFMQEVFRRWASIDSHRVVSTIGQEWPPVTPAMVHTSEEYWNRFFGEDGPKNTFVIPTDIDIFVYLPSKFYRMTKYRVRMYSETVEDYLENIYFVKTDMPYDATVGFLNELDETLE